MALPLNCDFGKRLGRGFALRCRLDVPATAGVTALYGPSGSGKTSILRCIAGVLTPDSGEIRLGGTVWYSRKDSVCIPPERRGVGLQHQDYALFPHLTVERNIAFGLHRLPPQEASRRVHAMMDVLGVAGLATRLPRFLSGGEAQRVALARELVREPSLLLLDEPLSALDGHSRARIRGELRLRLVESGIQTLVVTHDRAEALTLADSVAVVLGGEVAQHGPAHDVFARPASEGVAKAVGFENCLDADLGNPGPDRVRAVIGSGRVDFVPAPAGVPCRGPVTVCVRAEDVMLAPCPASNESGGTGTLTGRIRSIHDEGREFRVMVDAGVVIAALIPRKDHSPAVASGASVTVGFRDNRACVFPRRADSQERSA